jgi:hypothetical protein
VQLDSLPVNSLVRFRGMVQDMFDVEYYIGAYKVSIAGAIFHLNQVPISLAYVISHVIIFMLFNHQGCREAYCWNE